MIMFTLIKKEVLLLCDNISPVTFNIQPQQIIVSSTQISFLLFYAYWPYSRVRFNITIETKLHVKKYIF